MKLSEFINIYKKQDVESMKEVEISKYIPLNKKIEIIESIMIVISTIDLNNYFEIIRKKELIKFFNILLSYTNIEIDEYSEDVYDECLSCGIDKFFIHYAGSDYNSFCKIFDESMQISDTVLFRDAIMNVGNTNLAKDFESVLKDIKENEYVLDKLNNIIGFNNIGIKGATK